MFSVQFAVGIRKHNSYTVSWIIHTQMRVCSCHRCIIISHQLRRSQEPRRLKRGSAASCLLGLRVWIPPGLGCPSRVSIVCCQGEVPATGRSPVQRIPTEYSVFLKPRQWGAFGPSGAVEPQEKISSFTTVVAATIISTNLCIANYA
jgi:hypothetical protein